MSYFVTPLIPLRLHPLKKDIRFKKFFEETPNKYFCLAKRDNNCFYTSFTKALFVLIQKMTHEEVINFVDRLKPLKEEFERLNGSTLAFDDFYGTFVDEIKKPRENIISEEEHISDDYQELFIKYASGEPQDFYDYITAFIKLSISTHIKSNSAIYSAIIGDVEEYCKKNVDCMNVDAGDIEINALSQVFEIGIKVVQIESNYTAHSGDEKFFVTMLYSPGHFEPLFE